MLSDSSYSARSRLLRVLALVPVVLMLSDTEFGPNDFRISHMGPDGDTDYGLCDSNYFSGNPLYPDVAYNSRDHEYLVVWAADDTVDHETRIFAQRVDAATGALIGAGPTIVSDTTTFKPAVDEPTVVYNSTNNEYLVVWTGLHPVTTGIARDEIFVQRLTAAAAETGTNDLRISNMGPPDDDLAKAKYPAVAYNSVNNEYLVVWIGHLSNSSDDDVYGQRINAASGQETGSDDFVVSDIQHADQWVEPHVAYNRADNEYLVVWTQLTPFPETTSYVYGQRLDASSGAELGSDDFQISNSHNASYPKVAYGHRNNQYLVVWTGLVTMYAKSELYGQRLWASTATEVGPTDFRISDMGADDGASFGAGSPDVAYDGIRGEYVVVWPGDDDTGPLVNNEYEIFGQRIDGSSSAEVGANDFRITDMGPDGDTAYGASRPAIAFSRGGEYVVVWRGQDNTGTLVDDECEVFGQRLTWPHLETFVGPPNADPEGDAR